MLKRILIVVLFTVFLLPAASQAAAVDGVTDTEVTIGMSGPLSGPGALWGVVLLGANAWVDHINERGGIHGRKIKVIMRDDGYNPARALANLTEMKGKVFAVSPLMGTAIVHATKDFLAENRIFCIGPTVDVRVFEKYPKDKLRWFFISYPDYINEGEFLADYAVKSLAGKKLSLFHQNDPMGQMYVEGAKLAISRLPAGRASLGVAIPYDVTERALATHALKLKEGGADILLISATPTHAALILKELAKIDYRPKVLTASVLGDPIMYSIAGADVWEGVYPAGMAHTGTPGDLAVDRVIEIIKKYDPKIAGKEYLGLFGAVSMMHVVEGLKNAGRDLTQESMIKGMEMIKNWRPEGLGAPVTYGPDRRHGLNGSRLMRAEKGKHVPITDYVIYKPLF
ncbi:MAG: ABC transporter substrate-binding protein [Smithellaceae bacterium]|nr:ABC transporter substrate-binding protein [Smithellaceae bacterium]